MAVPTLVHVDGTCDCFRERANPPVFPRPRSSRENTAPAVPVRHLMPAARRHLASAG